MGKAWARLLTPSGAKAITGGRVTHATSQGVTGSIQLRQEINLNDLRDGTCQIVAENATDAYESPPMKAVIGEESLTSGGLAFSLELVDEPTFKLGNPGQSFPTFQNCTSTTIRQAIEGAAGVSVLGLLDWPVLIEDIKQSQLGDALRRLEAAQAYEHSVTSTGLIVCHSVMWSSGHYTFRPSVQGGVRRRYQIAKSYTGLRVEKSSPISAMHCFEVDPQQSEETSIHEFDFPNPLRNALYEEHGVSGGSLTQVILWNGGPGGAGATMVQWWSPIPVSGAVDPTLPATHATVVFTPSADAIANGIPGTFGICFIGSPVGLMSGVDLSFGQFFGDPARPFPDVYREQLIPTLAAATENWPGYLRQRNKGADTLSSAGRFQPDVELAATMEVASERAWPLAKIETYTHNFADSGFTTSVEAGVYAGLT